MASRSVTMFRAYQLSTHRTLGFFCGDQGPVLDYCCLKYNVEEDDIALERLLARRISREEVTCFKEIMSQVKDYSERLKEIDPDLEESEIGTDLVDILLDLEPSRPAPPRPSSIEEIVNER
ncbi:MAG: hypothetical protein QCI82_10070 [Candidatus Thermoplasmatota archaeon]|nr:hypothetical protein [Candidatus Thermoplasmatota archaeon]